MTSPGGRPTAVVFALSVDGHTTLREFRDGWLFVRRQHGRQHLQRALYTQTAQPRLVLAELRALTPLPAARTDFCQALIKQLESTADAGRRRDTLSDHVWAALAATAHPLPTRENRPE